MEPANLTPTPEDEQLETLLRRVEPPLPDDGFSVRVLAALPPVEPASSGIGAWLNVQTALVLAGALAGFFVAEAHGARWSDLTHLATSFESAGLSDWLLGAVIGGIALSFGLALSSEPEF